MKPNAPELSYGHAAAYALLIGGVLLVPTGVVRLLVPGRVNYFLGSVVLLVGFIAVLSVLARHPIYKGGPRTRTILVLSSIVALYTSIALMFPAFGTPLIRGGFSQLSWMLAFFGVLVIGRAMGHRRVGESLHCPKCDYELGFDPYDAPSRCPECGEPWLGRWQKGASRRSPMLGAVGAAMVLLGIFPLLMSFTFVGAATMTIVPTPALISITATDAWGHNTDAWSELTSRKLTPADEDNLAGKLLDLRLEAGYLYGQPSTWLEAAVTRKAISQALIDRYYGELFEPSIDVPDAVDQGAEVAITIRAKDRHGGSRSWMYIWLHSIEVDGAPIQDPVFETSRRQWVFSLDFTRSSLARTALGSDSPVHFPRLDTSTPGPRTVKVTAYRCLMPVGTMPQTVSEGPVVAPSGAIHFDRIEFEKTVNVRTP